MRLHKAESTILKALQAYGTAHGAKPVTTADIVVMAWQADKELFGLDGWKQEFPDSNKVLCKLYGKDHLSGMGFVEAVGTGSWMLTEKGQNYDREG